ncbi:ATP-dependent DNA ligase [bacterium]|nr:MAG: ATP-dependent DNA ligase [bacterium]
MSKSAVEISGRQLSLSNLEKILYPSCNFSKAQVIEYYRRISEFILPHLKDRALTLKRYPDGVEGEYFFEKRCPSHRPAWVETGEILREEGERMTVCLVNDLPTLIWAANLATLELHVPLARAQSPATPDYVVFDLDPGEGADLLDCARVALILRGLFDRLGLESFVKTSGQKGLHVYMPLNLPGAAFEDTKTFSRAVALTVEKKYPDLVTAKMAKTERAGRVFINWEQNDPKKTTICVYSLRAREAPFVSFPLGWEELEALAAEGDPEKLPVSHEEALRRAGEKGDLFRELLTIKQTLPHL